MRLLVNSSLWIEALDVSDQDALFDLTNRNRDYLNSWLPWVQHTTDPEHTKTFLRQVEVNNREGKGFQAGIFWHGQLVGMLGLREISRVNLSANIGYWLSEHATGQGLMTLSVRRLCQHGFDSGLNRIELRAAVDNERSWKIAERIGFQREGILRQVEQLPSGFVDHYLYSMLREDWEHLSYTL